VILTSRRHLLPLLLGLAVTALAACTSPPHGEAPRPPNVVLVFTDDQGYGDLSSAGHPTIHTPHIDRLAAEGVRLTQFYVASPVCSPSRAALLTGCYPKRVGMHEHVVFPPDDHGLHTDEVTLADMLRDAGYATGCFGKWHLGHRPGMLPTDQGFDTFWGVPYSNDMSRFHRSSEDGYRFRLPALRDDAVEQWEPDQTLLTRRTTEEAVAFLDAHAHEPFFVYVPYSMPHIPIFASPEFAGRSPRGLYGDVIEEIDAGVGALLEALERQGVADDTLVIFASDNGPWLPYKQQGGSAGPLRGGKGSNWEGGQRVPFVARWPARIPAARVCREPASAMDVMPTLAALAGGALPDHGVDGQDITDLLAGDADPARAERPERAFVYYTSHGELAGVRRGPWKLLLDGEQLFQLEHDVGEQWDLSAEHAGLVTELRDLAQRLDAEITAGARPALRTDETLFDPERPGSP
jgi:arylsulfatase A